LSTSNLPSISAPNAPNIPKTHLSIFMLLITNKKFYQIATESQKITMESSLADVHCVDDEPREYDPTPDILRISVYNQHLRHKGTLRGLMSLPIDVYTETHSIIAMNMDVRDEYVVVLRALLRNYWQPIFEFNHMLVPEIYQSHLFVTKVNKHGKGETRCIAMSNERLYNFDVVEGVAMKPSKLKWSIKISAIVKIVLNKEDRRMLTIFTQLPKIKQQISFRFMDEQELTRTLNELKRLFIVNTRSLNTVIEFRLLIEDGIGPKIPPNSPRFSTIRNILNKE